MHDLFEKDRSRNHMNTLSTNDQTMRILGYRLGEERFGLPAEGKLIDSTLTSSPLLSTPA